MISGHCPPKQWRNHLSSSYESPSKTETSGRRTYSPRLWRSGKEGDLLFEHYRSQAGRQWFTRDLLAGVARIRGMECQAPDQVAEAFYGRKIVF